MFLVALKNVTLPLKRFLNYKEYLFFHLTLVLTRVLISIKLLKNETETKLI